MAATNFTPISLYYSATPSAVPTAPNLVAGELALNTYDGKLYYENSSGVVTLLASATTVTNSFSAGTTGLTPNTATTGAVTLAGTLAVANGGTGITSFGTGVATALGVNTGTAGAFVVNGGALGTPSSGTVTNLTGTASININGTVGATTATTGAFTTLSATKSSTGDVATFVGSGGYTAYINSSGTGVSFGDIASLGANWSGIRTIYQTSVSTYAAGFLVTSTSSTGLAVTGTLSATGQIISTTGNDTFPLVNQTGTTGFQAIALQNTTGNMTVGVQGSDATALIATGATAFDTVLRGTPGISFSANSGTSTQMRLSSTGLAVTGTLSSTLGANFATTSGDVGIGTSSPSSFTTGGTPILVVGNNAQTQITLYGGSSTGDINFATSNSGAGLYKGVVRYDGTSNFMSFWTNSAEKMRITSAGVFCFGTTAPINDANGAGAGNFKASSTALEAYRLSTSTNTIAQFFSDEGSTGSLRCAISCNGGIANYQANDSNLSDAREKTDIELAGAYLNKICAIPVKTFNYINQSDGGLTLGVIAQDVQTVAPELVMESNWAKKDDEPKMRLSIYQTDLQYALMKCIQEQQALITQLTDRITALETA